MALLERLNDLIWGIPLLTLLMGTHIYFTLKLHFPQRNLLYALKLSLGKADNTGQNLSPFSALATTLAATLGTGNIIGVGTAIFLGGPGAVFWCWITGVFGIATKYAESLIGVKYRVKTPDGKMQGGAMYALERGLGLKWLGVLFAAFAVVASFGIGCGTQINAIAEVIQNNVPVKIPALAIGVVGGLFTGIVIIGGIQSIASVCEKLVPFMAFFYVLGCIGILAVNRDYLGAALTAIVQMAFVPGAVAGGLVGRGIMMAAQFGVARGLFSNESGLGSAPLVASAAQTRNPVRQALVSATGTFWDTVVVCAMTGLVLVSTIMKNPDINMDMIENGGQLTTAAFNQIPVLGPLILVVGIITFAWSTILGWSYYGERCAQYLWGKKSILPYKILFVLVVVIGPVMALDLVWTISDILNAFMAVPNLIAVLLLSGVIAKDTKYYLGHLDELDTTEIPTVDR